MMKIADFGNFRHIGGVRLDSIAVSLFTKSETAATTL